MFEIMLFSVLCASALTGLIYFPFRRFGLAALLGSALVSSIAGTGLMFALIAVA